MELPRLVEVMAVVPLLLFVVKFSTCAASSGSVDDEVPAAVRQEASPPPGGLRGPTPSGCAACICPSPPFISQVRNSASNFVRLDVTQNPRNRVCGIGVCGCVLRGAVACLLHEAYGCTMRGAVVYLFTGLTNHAPAAFHGHPCTHERSGTEKEQAHRRNGSADRRDDSSNAPKAGGSDGTGDASAPCHCFDSSAGGLSR